ncbi:MAG: hypothetical protein DHS20C09_08580 [marine bacterium B5-7]|nr:MAG: hypothetical protein DHS20C09_08580 [marine bacterium B5-7]
MHKLLFIIFLCFISLAIAATEDDKTKVTTNNQQTETEKNNPSASTVETPDSFDPTENLSQDVPAAFPVDI